MLSKKNRLAKDREVKKVFEQGRGFFNSQFSLKFLKTSSTARFAIAVSAKVSTKAVKRNRLKRIIRELLRKEITKLAPGDYIFMLKPTAGQTAESHILASLRNLLEKSKLISREHEQSQPNF